MADPVPDSDSGAQAGRQLARLRFDLHDGPQQDVVLLAEDLRMLHAQLESTLDGTAARELVLGHLEDLQARLVALDADLRRIASQMESPFLPEQSFERALEQLVEDFTGRTELSPAVALSGDFTSLSDSQRITLLALIQEALHNIREHADAREVRIHVAVHQGEVEARVEDDGRGFDVEATIGHAIREGHMGLFGMHERVQMLGGTTKIDSRPGGPTIISARLSAPDLPFPAG